jgi:hypothetical protein
MVSSPKPIVISDDVSGVHDYHDVNMDFLVRGIGTTNSGKNILENGGIFRVTSMTLLTNLE